MDMSASATRHHSVAFAVAAPSVCNSLSVNVAMPDGRPLGGSQLRSYFSPFVGQSTVHGIKFASAGYLSLQRRFPVDCILISSGHICD